MVRKDADYYRSREQAERAAAKNAACPYARRVHQELAQAYARLVTDKARHEVSPSRSR